MKETIFTLKKGIDVPDKFDGVTVPILAAASNEDMLKIAGDKAYIVFNRAHVLDVQKAVKDASQEEGATTDGLRKLAADSTKGDWYKDAGTRARTGEGPKVKPQAVAAVLGEDFLAMLTPEQRKLYDAKMAEQAAKVAKKPEPQAEQAKAAPLSQLDAARAKQAAEAAAPAGVAPTKGGNGQKK